MVLRLFAVLMMALVLAESRVPIATVAHGKVRRHVDLSKSRPRTSCNFDNVLVDESYIASSDCGPPYSECPLYSHVDNCTVPQASGVCGTFLGYYNVEFTSTQIIFTYLIDTNWTVYNNEGFNGPWLSKEGGSWDSWADAAVDPATSTMPKKFSSDENNIYINWEGVAYTTGDKVIINLCGTGGSCSANSNCHTCTEDGCEWCLDSKMCMETPGTCHNYINQPKYCPKADCSSFTACKSCAGSGECAWCLTSDSCVQPDDTSCQNHIQNPSYCELQLNKL